MGTNPFVKMASIFLEKQAISRKLVEGVTSRALQGKSFKTTGDFAHQHEHRAKKITKALKNPNLTPEEFRALANTKGNHERMSEIARGIGSGREKALHAHSAEEVAKALPAAARPAPRLGSFELPRINGKKVLIGAGATALGLLALKALAKRRETEQGYDQPY